MSTALYRSTQWPLRETQAGAGLPPGTLMQRAGETAAQWILAWLSRQDPEHTRDRCVLLLCGPGNNGGDGLVCAQQLARRGVCTRVWQPQASRTPDATQAMAHWQADPATQHTAASQLPDPAQVCLVVDALFGVGLQRPLGSPYLEAIATLRDAALPCLALDLPSGLHADTGQWLGGVPGLTAIATLSFLGGKPGLYMAVGKDAAGTVVDADLGIRTDLPTSGTLNGPAAFSSALRPRPQDSHKGTFGTVAVVGGAGGMVGAALLAGRAALRLGAGKVYVHCLGAPDLPFDPLCPELMFRATPHWPAQAIPVLGCGLGQDASAQACLDEALASETPLVLDADALNLLARVPATEQGQCLAHAAGVPRVITPHPSEAARLLGTDTTCIQANRIDAARTLCRQTGAIVVLKGAGSVIASPFGPDLPYWINPSGNARLASAGTGDVLAGMIGALVARAWQAGACNTDQAVLQAVLAAVWFHGRAADCLSQMTASDLAPMAARLLARASRPPRGGGR